MLAPSATAIKTAFRERKRRFGARTFVFAAELRASIPERSRPIGHRSINSTTRYEAPAPSWGTAISRIRPAIDALTLGRFTSLPAHVALQS
jgi:hypothetical protein